jgi:4-amino-4-deoxy-L-arabinose transferase-like glycosyltransferase
MASWLPIAAVLAIALASHLRGIRAIEFTGEDELLFLRVSEAFLRLAAGQIAAAGEIVSFYYPPLQAALPAPLIALFGAQEWTMRLPGAVCGAATAGVLYAIVREATGDRRAAGLAALLYALSGIGANNKFALTSGVLCLGLAVACLGLVRLVARPGRREQDRALLLAAVGIVWAMMTLPDAYFCLPVLGLAWWRQRRLDLSRASAAAWGIVAAWMLLYGALWIVVPRLVMPQQPGGMMKLGNLLADFGTVRLRELAGSFLTVSSVPAVLLFFPAAAASLGHRRPALAWMAAFYGLPLLLWTFVFGYANVRAAHLLNAWPLFCAVFGAGAVDIGDALGRQGRGRPAAQRAWVAAMALALLSVAWNNARLNLTDRLERRVAWIHGPKSLEMLAQGRRFERLGQAVAGRFVRKHSPEGCAVISNTGGSFGDFYARRPAMPTSLLAEVGDNPAAWKARNLRYLLQAPSRSVTGAPDLLSLWPVALELKRNGRTTLLLRDLWKEATTVAVLDAQTGQPLPWTPAR